MVISYYSALNVTDWDHRDERRNYEEEMRIMPLILIAFIIERKFRKLVVLHTARGLTLLPLSNRVKTGAFAAVGTSTTVPTSNDLICHPLCICISSLSPTLVS